MSGNIPPRTGYQFCEGLRRASDANESRKRDIREGVRKKGLQCRFQHGGPYPPAPPPPPVTGFSPSASVEHASDSDSGQVNAPGSGSGQRFGSGSSSGQRPPLALAPAKASPLGDTTPKTAP
eukprot:4989220-Heterocapsa_arctica.AAC.1